MKIQEVDMYNMHVRRSRTAALVMTLVACACLVGILPSQAAAQAKVGTTGAQFLELGPSARAMGMGEAYVAVVDDISAVYYNPAALTSLLGREAMCTYIDMPADVQYGSLAFGFPVESVGGVLGFAAYYLTSGSMPERTYENAVDDEVLGIEGTGREFAWNDMAFSVGYGRYLTDRFSIGFTVRYINESVHEYSANGWSADVGVDYNTGYRGFRLSMAISNFGPDMKFIQKDYPLPINFRFGGAINILEGVDHRLTLAAEGSHPSDNLEKYNTGLEYTFKDMFSLRAGSRFNYDCDGVTFGGGVRIPYREDTELRLDYAYQDFGILTEVHRFTMSLAF